MSHEDVAESTMEFLLMEIVNNFGIAEGRPGESEERNGQSESQVDGTDSSARNTISMSTHRFAKLEAMGFGVGQKLAERNSKKFLRFTDELDIIKFICKEFWIEVFRKQVDNLRTNHRGVYVLHDNRFRWLLRYSAATQSESIACASQMLAFPCGIVRGSLDELGIAATVVASISSLPACTFTITIQHEDQS